MLQFYFVIMNKSSQGLNEFNFDGQPQNSFSSFAWLASIFTALLERRLEACKKEEEGGHPLMKYDFS